MHHEPRNGGEKFDLGFKSLLAKNRDEKSDLDFKVFAIVGSGAMHSQEVDG